MANENKSATSSIVFFGLLAVVIAVYLFVLRPMNRGTQGEKHPAIGATLPALSLDPLRHGDPSLTSAELKGKVLLINFWATWCGPCLQEFPHMVAIEKKFRSDPHFQMVSIAAPGQGETEDDMRTATVAYLEQRKAEMPVYLDPYSVAYRDIMHATAAQGGIPLTLVVDREGIVRGMWEGYGPGTENDIEALITQLLARKS